MTDAMIIGITGIAVAIVNILPQMFWKKETRKEMEEVIEKVDKLYVYIKNDQDEDEVRKKMCDIQSYYVNLMDEDLRPVAIMKSDSFIDLTINIGMHLSLEDVDDYVKFKEHLYSGSKYCKIRMAQLIGNELTEKYYLLHDLNTIRFDKIVQKIFFTTDNSKKQKFISASVDFMQLFLTELQCLKNGNKKHFLEEDKQLSRRCDDHK